jgi:hypothetical protein
MSQIGMTIEAHVTYTTALPMQGRLEYVLVYPVDKRDDNSASVDSASVDSASILDIITPYVLEELGGTDENWIIICEPRIKMREFVFSFEWKDFKNNLYPTDIVRIKTFRPDRHRITIPMA